MINLGHCIKPYFGDRRSNVAFLRRSRPDRVGARFQCWRVEVAADLVQTSSRVYRHVGWRRVDGRTFLECHVVIITEGCCFLTSGDNIFGVIGFMFSILSAKKRISGTGVETE